MIDNILIVDDSAIDRKIIRQTLEQKLPHVQVIETVDGCDIQEKIIKNQIKACILDILMPKKNGLLVLQEIKKTLRTMDVPVIVCTGLGDQSSIENALELGAYDYFTKPLNDEMIRVSLPLKVKNAINLMKRTEEILYIGYHDLLTGLYNRRFYEEEVRRLDIERNLPMTIVLGDVNGLKLVNDAFGHERGDELLKKAADSFKSACRADDIIARWGGDEFIMLLPKAEKEHAEIIIKRIRETYKKEHVNDMHLNISFGIDSKYRSEQSILQVIKNTEDALYRNKVSEMESVRSNMISTIINTLHEKNPREERHSNRVSEICQQIAEAINLSDTDVCKIKLVGLLHDIGKIAVDENILNKPGKLDELEWIQMKKHPEIGYRIIGSSYEMQEYAQYILAHHERWDGKGYPKGLKGEDIPLISRIVTIADAFDAMTRERPYKDCLTLEQAVVEIIKNANMQFDAIIARAFVEKVLNREWVV